MKQPSLAIVASAAILVTGACSDTHSPPSTPPPASPPAVTTPEAPPPPLPPLSDKDAGMRAKDTAASRPMDTMSKAQESKSMPMAGQGNNHSSPSLEPGAKE